MTITRWQCSECYAITRDEDILTRPNPFDIDHDVHGCPECKAVDSFEPVCDEPGCDSLVTCGWPSVSGYRNTCHVHSAWLKEYGL